MDVGSLGGSGALAGLQDRMFQRADRDGNGTLNKQEFTEAARQAAAQSGGSGLDVDATFAKLDKDGDAELTRDELTAGMREMMKGMKPEGMPGLAGPPPGGGSLSDQLFASDAESEEELLDLLMNEYQEAQASGDFSNLLAIAGSLKIRA